jgi:pseudouridine kinase
MGEDHTMDTEEGHVLVIGSAGIDIKGRPLQEVVWETSNLGRVRNSVGGVARNIAENLARLEVPTVLLTAVGKDPAGKRVLSACQRVGIDCSYIRQIPGARTGTYMALLHPDGQLHVAISDFEIIDSIEPDYVLEHENLLAEAEIVVIDATLSEAVLQTIFELAARHKVRVAADPTTPALAGRLRRYLSQLYLVVPNTTETIALCDGEPAADYDTGIKVARQLVSAGTQIGVVTMGPMGLAYADSGGGGYIRAIKTKVVDTTGAGDAFTGAVIFGMLNDVPVDEAMRLGITAASLTLESRHTVLPDLSQELLYNKLMA